MRIAPPLLALLACAAPSPAASTTAPTTAASTTAPTPASSTTAPTHPGCAAPAARPQDHADPPPVAENPPEDLDALLEPVRAQHGLPALAALVLRGGAVVAEGAVGVRRVDRDAPVTRADRWHLGSCTKSMTATLAAVLVARDEVSWDTTVGAVFGDVEMDPAWREVTLAMLLTNSAGAPDDLSPGGLWNRLWMRAGSPVEERRVLVAGVLGKPPVAPPGTRFLYSNAGFAIAGAMLETRTGRPYEALLAAELFAPLGMTRAGFGAPGEPNREGGEPDEPHGHFLRRGELQVRELGFGDDNPPAIAPAGLVHAPLRDWARYAALHLAGARGEPVPAAFHGVDFPRLHEPRLDGYAMGWVVSADGATLWHNGSNTMWYCEIALFPAEDLAVLVATNTAHGTAREAAAGVLRTLHERGMAPAGDAPR